MCTPHVGTLSASATGFGNPKNADVDASKSSAHVLNISTDVVSAAGLASGIVSNRSSSDNNSAVANKPTPANASTTTPGRPTVATGAVDATVRVSRSGVHYLLLASCAPSTGSVLVSGSTAWLNPHGYLPAELYAFLPFFGAMAALYSALLALWVGLCVRHRSLLLPLQVTYRGSRG